MAVTAAPAVFNACLTLAIPGWKFNINRVRREDAAAALNDVFASLCSQLEMSDRGIVMP